MHTIAHNVRIQPGDPMLRLTFALFDKNGDGVISGNEIRDVLSSMDIASNKEISQLLKVYKGKEMNFDDFVELLTSCTSNNSTITQSTSLYKARASSAYTPRTVKKKYQNLEISSNHSDDVERKKKNSFSRSISKLFKPITNVLSSSNNNNNNNQKSPMTPNGTRKIYVQAQMAPNPAPVSSKQQQHRLSRISSYVNNSTATTATTSPTVEDQWRDVFQFFDQSDKGFITKKNFLDAVRKLGLEAAIEKNELDELFSLVSTHDVITFRQFMELYKLCC
jgi:Ca2+-binding EF-hand superfamily protein